MEVPNTYQDVSLRKDRITNEKSEYSKHIGELRSLVSKFKERKPVIIDLETFDTPSVPVADQVVKDAVASNMDGIWTTSNHSNIRIISVGPTSRGGTRGQSAHQADYVEISYFDGNKRVDGVAVYKPFTQTSERRSDNKTGAIKELVNCSLVKDRGHDTVTPICAITDGNKSYFLSLYRPDVVSLDQDVWNDISTLNPREEEAVTERLQRIGELLASYHEDAISHQDPQMKNFSELADGEIIGFDWESAKIFKDMRLVNPDTILTVASHDLEAVFSSLARNRSENGVGLLENLSGNARWHVFKKLVFDHYLEHWVQKISRVQDQDFSDQMITVLGDIEEKIKKYIIRYTPILH